MKINEAKEKILAIFADTVDIRPENDTIPENFMVTFIEKLISSCGETCHYNEDEKKSLFSCLDALKNALESYRSTTTNIQTITTSEIPLIGTIIEEMHDEKLHVASSRLKTLQKHLQEEIKTADTAIKVFQTQVEMIKTISKFDPVTKLMNAYTFADNILPLIRIGERRSLDMGMIMLQVENYHDIIDTHGDAVFNKVLIYIAKVLRSFIRKENLIYRYNHNTFLVLFNRTTMDEMVQSKKRILAQITKNAIEYNKKPVALNILAAKTTHQKGDTVDTLIKRLDEQKNAVK